MLTKGIISSLTLLMQNEVFDKTLFISQVFVFLVRPCGVFICAKIAQATSGCDGVIAFRSLAN
jgi:putative Ca2+/H+ antiporter (TMEM165/GDT1 family)